MFTSDTTASARSSLRIGLLAGLAVAGMALLAGCGDDAKGEAAAPAATVAHTTEHAGHATTVPATDAPATTAPTTAPPPSTAPADTAPVSTAPATTAPLQAPSEIDVTTADYSFDLSSEVAAAGPVTFVVTNNGAEAHQMQVAAVPDGFTPADFLDTLHSEGERAAFSKVVWAGGVNGVQPGTTQVATSDLPPGHYIAMCFIPTPGEQGVPHVDVGMMSEFDVVEAADVAPAPLPVATVELADYSIAIPERFTGGVTEIVNNGQENHEMILLKFHDGKSLPDLAAWSGAPDDQPFDYVGGIGTLAPGAHGWATLTLDSGDYVALCFVPGPEGQPHLEMGMVTPFSVT